jgi:hypothetical protein
MHIPSFQHGNRNSLSVAAVVLNNRSQPGMWSHRSLHPYISSSIRVLFNCVIQSTKVYLLLISQRVLICACSACLKVIMSESLLSIAPFSTTRRAWSCQPEWQAPHDQLLGVVFSRFPAFFSKRSVQPHISIIRFGKTEGLFNPVQDLAISEWHIRKSQFGPVPDPQMALPGAK